MSERTIYVVELANVIVFAAGIVSQMVAVYCMVQAKRYRDTANAWAESAKTWKRSAEALEQSAREFLREAERSYGVRTGVVVTKEKDAGKN